MDSKTISLEERAKHSQGGGGTPPPEKDRRLVPGFADLLTECAESGARDIVFDTRNDVTTLRARIAGRDRVLLQVSAADARSFVESVLSSARGGGAFSETRAHRTTAKLGEKTTLFHVTYWPKRGGSRTIFRPELPLPQGQGRALEDLEISDSHIKIVRTIAARPGALTIIAGPKDSGKTTMMGAIVDWLKRDHPNLSVASLSAIKEEIDRTAGASFKPEPICYLDNHSVDVLTVDEAFIDSQGVEVIRHATEAGIKVVMTMLAPSGVGAIAKLARIGFSLNEVAHPWFVAGVIYQRLIPKLCERCRKQIEEEDISIDLKYRLYTTLSEQFHDIFVASAAGCERCAPATPGLQGRTPCVETIIPDARVLEAVRIGDCAEAESRWRATQDKTCVDNFHGRTALEHGIAKLKAGVVSPVDIEAAFGPIDFQTHMSDGVAEAHEFGKVD